MTTYKQVHIQCDRVVCRGEFLGDIDIYANVKVPGECHNYKEPGLGDNWFIEMYVTKSNTPKIEQGYTYLKQVVDGLAKAKITFIEFDEIDVTGKEVWIMTPEQADLIGETLEMDCESSMIDREIRDPLNKAVEAIEEYDNLEGTIMLFHKEE